MPANVLSKARTQLLLNNPFFGSLAMQWNVIEDKSIPTIWTNGSDLRYNPEYMGSLRDAHQQAVVAHEVMHCALLHVYRRGSRDPMQWNEAADFVVNGILSKAGFELPEGAYQDAQFDGMSAEQVYSKRQHDQQQENEPGDENQGGGGNTPGKGDKGAPGSPNGDSKGNPMGEFGDAPEPESGDPSGMTEQDWELAAEQAARVAMAAGMCPAGMEISLKGTREPRVDWVTETRDFITHTIPNTRSWSTPDRRFIASNLYLPGTKGENVGTLVVAVDSSGSTIPFVNQFTDEFRGILREARPERVVLIYCDAAVQSVEEFGADDFDAKLTVKGGGGTAFKPVFDYVEAEGIEPKALVYLTDMDNSDCASVVDPGYPVLWAVPQYVTTPAPFGRLVTIEENR